MIHGGITKCEKKFARTAVQRLPTEQSRRLYLLSFLLTADRAKAEQCFVPGLDWGSEESAAFRDWAYSWARRIVVRNALRAVGLHSGKGKQQMDIRGSGNTAG